MHVTFLSQSAALRIAFLAAAAFVAGFINSIAGGGSFIAFPALLKSGILPIRASATRLVALWPGQFASIIGYREDLRRNARLIAPVTAVALIGSFSGTWVLLHHSARTFLLMVPYFFLFASVAYALSGPMHRMVQRRPARAGGGSRVLFLPLMLALLGISFYMGYFGAGAGLLVMAALTFCGIERIAEINALKVITTSVANGAACITFIVHAAIAWHDAWYMMIACAVGGYIGARGSRRISDRVLRPVIVVYGLSLAVYFFVRHGRI